MGRRRDRAFVSLFRMPIDLETRRRARTGIAFVAAVAFLVAALVPKLQGQGINRVMLSLALVFVVLFRVWSRRRLQR